MNENALDKPVDWVVIAEVVGMAEGEILVGRLRTAGIPAWISRESAGTAFPLTYGPLGRIDVVVPAACADDARALLFGEEDPEAGDADELLGEASALLDDSVAAWLEHAEEDEDGEQHAD